MEKQHTNELTLEFLTSSNEPPFTAGQMAGFSEDVLATIQEQADFEHDHPVTAIFRFATVGSLTRLGGRVSTGSSQLEITRENGERISFALAGDEVTYSDGSTAMIVSGAGQQYSEHCRSMALVGSTLDNGDMIISTPQDVACLVQRDDVPVAEDFLTVAGA